MMDDIEKIGRDLDQWHRDLNEYYNQLFHLKTKPPKDKKSIKKGKRPPVPNSIKNEVKFRQNYSCQHCGRTLPATAHIHHKIHVSEGGTTTLDNLIALCPDCHTKHHHEEQLKEAQRQSYQKEKKTDDNFFSINKEWK